MIILNNFILDACDRAEAGEFYLHLVYILLGTIYLPVYIITSITGTITLVNV